MIGVVTIETVLVYDLPAMLTTLATLGVAYMGLKSQRRVEPKVHAIDDAVNNTESEQTIRENVQDLADGTKP